MHKIYRLRPKDSNISTWDLDILFWAFNGFIIAWSLSTLTAVKDQISANEDMVAVKP